MTLSRKLIALVSLTAILLAALVPASSATMIWAIVVPFLLFFALLAVAPAERRPDESMAPDFLCFRDIASRAPPAATPLG